MKTINTKFPSYLVGEKFLKSTLWKSPLNGVVELEGTGKGSDALGFSTGEKFSFNFFDMNKNELTPMSQGKLHSIFNGGCTPLATTSKYYVKKHEVYQIWLATHDAQVAPHIKGPLNATSFHAVFDRKVALGALDAYNENSYFYRSEAKFSAPFESGKIIHINQRDNFANFPANGENGTGVGGLGFSGTLESKGEGIYEIVSMEKNGGTGGTGYLKITYPYQWMNLFSFENNFLAKKKAELIQDVA